MKVVPERFCEGSRETSSGFMGGRSEEKMTNFRYSAFLEIRV